MTQDGKNAWISAGILALIFVGLFILLYLISNVGEWEITNGTYGKCHETIWYAKYIPEYVKPADAIREAMSDGKITWSEHNEILKLQNEAYAAMLARQNNSKKKLADYLKAEAKPERE